MLYVYKLFLSLFFEPLVSPAQSLITLPQQVFNYLIGSLTRIFTTLQEVDDPLILYGYLAGFALNAVLAAQMLYYWNAPAQPRRKEALKHIQRKAVTGGKGAQREEALAHVRENVGVARGGSGAGSGAEGKGTQRQEALEHIRENVGVASSGVGSGVERKGPSTRRRG